jgi:hypothetical protein
MYLIFSMMGLWHLEPGITRKSFPPGLTIEVKFLINTFQSCLLFIERNVNTRLTEFILPQVIPFLPFCIRSERWYHVRCQRGCHSRRTVYKCCSQNINKTQHKDDKMYMRKDNQCCLERRMIRKADKHSCVQ